jgi:MerR family transcriptional regulator/heat shock protein HspR
MVGRTGPEGAKGAEGRDAGRGVYIISVAAELVGVHPQTLRIYERKGLLMPSRTSGNTRRYSERDIARLRTIQRLTQEGVSLAGVKMIVEMEIELDRLRERTEELHREIERSRERGRQEVEAVRQQGRGALVPLRDVRQVRMVAGRRVVAQRLVGQQPRPRTRPGAGPDRPIALGPGS